MWASNIKDSVPVGVDPWQVSLNYMMPMVVFSGLVIMATYYWMNRNVLTDERFFNPNEVKKKKSKTKMSMKESFLFLAKSKFIGCLCILVLGYGIAINLVEVTWKGQLKLQYPNANDYMAFMGGFSLTVGLVTFAMYFIGGWVIRTFGWRTGALATPIMLLVTGLAFFAFILFKDLAGGIAAVLGSTPLMLAVIFGAAQNIVSKSTKYSLFDPTKEMAYIPLDQESKVKGKAAIDVVGARLGKSGGALINIGLIVAFGSLGAITPYLFVLLIGVMALWIFSANTLAGLLETLTGEKKAETTAAKTTEEKPALQVEQTTEAEVKLYYTKIVHKFRFSGVIFFRLTKRGNRSKC
jgi:AAA family ATP:ADP antiporter